MQTIAETRMQAHAGRASDDALSADLRATLGAVAARPAQVLMAMAVVAALILFHQIAAALPALDEGTGAFRVTLTLGASLAFWFVLPALVKRVFLALKAGIARR